MSGSRVRQTASRRQFLRLSGAVVGAAFLAACGSDPDPSGPRRLTEGAPELTVSPTPTAALTSSVGVPGEARRRTLPLGDRRQLERLALPGTPWETPVYINRSGAPGPSVMILGGVHGNEPGGWAAAREIADWMPDRGVTIVIPRANIIATEALERTLPELGDLNRFYPGEPPESTQAFPMQWMAYSIVELAHEFEVSLLLDLHESWGFFNERTADGTAFLGQTITNGADVSETPRIEAVTSSVNAVITDREQLILRDRTRNRFTNFTQRPNFDPSWPTGGTSSLGIGNFVPGLVPVLVEMGQQGQPESRRAELHQLVVRAALEHEGLLTA